MRFSDTTHRCVVLIQLMQENTAEYNSIYYNKKWLFLQYLAIFCRPRTSLLTQNTKGRQSLFRKRYGYTEISCDSKWKNKSRPYWVGIHSRCTSNFQQIILLLTITGPCIVIYSCNQKTTRCTISQNYFIKYSTCFGKFTCPPPGVSQHCI